MNSPKVSVIIPTYNGADFLGEAIQSVLNQTYPDFELIIVNDLSPDHTDAVVGQFNDSRLKYLIHRKNHGADVARYTGLKASSGEIIAFLDQDDFFHPDKLQAHAEYLENHPDIGFTYNARFELNYSSNTIREIYRPPRTLTLEDLVLRFSICPSDIVLRREWALDIDWLDGGRGSEISFFGRLFLEGCKFAGIDRVLNYRRYHSGRIISDLLGACEAELNNQAKVFSDPRCPARIFALRDVARANILMYWAYLSFAQNDTVLGQSFVREAARLKPSILDGMPSELVSQLLLNCIADEGQNHEILLKNVFFQLPPEMARLSEQYPWAIGRGYLLKGARAAIWHRCEDASRYFGWASELGCQVDESYLSGLTHHLLNYEMAFGAEATQDVLHTLVPFLEALAGRTSIRDLNGLYALNRAFQRFHDGDYTEVPKMIFQAVASNPKYLTNRGVLSILLRTGVRMGAKVG